jgi:aminopeptidase N
MTKFSRLQKEQLRSVAEPIWKNIVQAAAELDYARFSRGFSNDLLAKLSEQHFRQSCEDFPVLTSIEPGFEFIDSIHRENSVTILWRLASSKYAGEFLGLLTLQSGESGMEITALSVN